MAKDSAGRRMPWFKLWTKDFMADPVVQAMSWDKRGRYLWAMMCSWETDTPGSATEIEWQRWMGYTTEGWDMNSGDYPLCGDARDNRLVQERLRSEYERTAEEQGNKSVRGVAGAKARWNGHAQALLKQCPGNAAVNGSTSEASEASERIKSKPKTVPQAPPALAGLQVPVIELPLRDGSLHPVYSFQITRWEKAFPDVLVMDTLREQLVWLESNPSRRKTKRGVLRFVTSWLNREQNTPKETNHGAEARRSFDRR